MYGYNGLYIAGQPFRSFVCWVTRTGNFVNPALSRYHLTHASSRASRRPTLYVVRCLFPITSTTNIDSIFIYENLFHWRRDRSAVHVNIPDSTTVCVVRTVCVIPKWKRFYKTTRFGRDIVVVVYRVRLNISTAFEANTN